MRSYLGTYSLRQKWRPYSKILTVVVYLGTLIQMFSRRQDHRECRSFLLHIMRIKDKGSPRLVPARLEFRSLRRDLQK